jgi:hypothetical protein
MTWPPTGCEIWLTKKHVILVVWCTFFGSGTKDMAPSGVDITCENEFKILISTNCSINICLISHQNSNIEFFRNFLEFGQHGSKLKHDVKVDANR